MDQMAQNGHPTTLNTTLNVHNTLNGNWPV
jgi:hypothetical protein